MLATRNQIAGGKLSLRAGRPRPLDELPEDRREGMPVT
jgi:hypothetical protein